MHKNHTGARPQAGIYTILSDPGVKALWETLSADQKSFLLAMHDRLGHVTLSEVVRTRRILPAEPYAAKGLSKGNPANDHTREQVCPACNGTGISHSCYGPGVALVHGEKP